MQLRSFISLVLVVCENDSATTQVTKLFVPKHNSYELLKLSMKANSHCPRDMHILDVSEQMTTDLVSLD
jgi:hypothetical protein